MSKCLRTAAIALSCALAPLSGNAQISDGLRLQLERQLRLTPTRPERDSAKFLSADRIVGEPDRSVVATGDVVLRQRGASIRADRVDYQVEEDRKSTRLNSSHQ